MNLIDLLYQTVNTHNAIYEHESILMVHKKNASLMTNDLIMVLQTHELSFDDASKLSVPALELYISVKNYIIAQNQTVISPAVIIPHKLTETTTEKLLSLYDNHDNLEDSKQYRDETKINYFLKCIYWASKGRPHIFNKKISTFRVEYTDWKYILHYANKRDIFVRRTNSKTGSYWMLEKYIKKDAEITA